ncbi:MAG TPA: pyridoxamine 5'-phosphate oxidase family protein [Pseudonocardiaceae bacterium]|nr:pyridoxamine 5'-phosphate oxidase family protein [Pseudonocardiaceae bacterium]
MSHVSAVLGAVHETPPELDRLQGLLDSSAAGAGEHLRSIITDERRLDAPRLCAELTGMRLLTVATVTADGRPLAGPVDGYFLHGAFWFSTGAHSVRARHLSARPVISVNHVPDDHFAVSAHGTATLSPFPGSDTHELRQAMLDHYLPLQGPSFGDWLDQMTDGVGVRVDATKMFVFYRSS